MIAGLIVAVPSRHWRPTAAAGAIDGEDRLRRVWMGLTDEDYIVATQAHQDMSTVAVRGDLVRRGTRLFLINPAGFRSVPGAD
jgi:hypothetical protein